MAKIWHKIKKHKILFSLVFILTAFIGFSFPLFSSARYGVDDAIFVVLGWILALFLVFLQFILYLAGMILDLVLGHALSVQETDMVAYGWALARDVANMFFIIFLLVIAFATIFRIEAYQYKALLPKLIWGILLVNFSRTIATIFIEFSNLLTAAFLNFDSPGKISSAALLALMGVDKVWDIPEQMGINIWITHDFAMVVSLAGIVFIVAILVVAIAGFAGMLVIRTISLLVLTVFSPVAFVLGILPATKKFFDEWWENFLKYIFYAPLAAFALYLAMKVGSQMNVKKPVGLGSGLQGEASEATAEAAIKSIGSFGFASNAEGFYGFCLVVGLLLFSIVIIQKIGGVLAGFMIGLAKGGMLFAGREMARKVDRWLAKDKPGRTRKLLKGAAEALQKRGGGLATLGKGISGLEKGLGFLGSKTKYFSPTVVKNAWKANQAEKDHRAFNESIGKVRTVMNKCLMNEDKTDYGKIAQMEEVDRRKKIYKAANPSGEYPYYVSEWIRAAKDGRKEDFAALTELLEESNNGNEGIQRLIQHPEWQKMAGKFFDDDFLKEHKDVAMGKSITYNAETMRAMVRHILGDNMAKMIAGRLSATGMHTGNWAIWTGAVDADLKTGELKWRKLATRNEDGDVTTKEDYKGSQEEEAAGQLAKQGETGLNKAFRATYAELKYEKQADGTVKEVHETPSVTMQIYARDYGPPQGAANRLGRSMGPYTQEAIADVADKIRTHIGKGEAGPDAREELERWLQQCERVSEKRK